MCFMSIYVMLLVFFFSKMIVLKPFAILLQEMTINPVSHHLSKMIVFFISLYLDMSQDEV